MPCHVELIYGVPFENAKTAQSWIQKHYSILSSLPKFPKALDIYSLADMDPSSFASEWYRIDLTETLTISMMPFYIGYPIYTAITDDPHIGLSAYFKGPISIPTQIKQALDEIFEQLGCSPALYSVFNDPDSGTSFTAHGDPQ